MCGLCFSASGQSFYERLEQGYDTLHEGDIDGALATFRDLQTDDPESDLVYYSLASAQYAQALSDIEQNAQQEALTGFADARGAFASLLTSRDRFIRENAEYNAANCSAQIAKISVGMGDQEEMVAAFENSIYSYEDILRKRPEHGAARANLNHMRYLLKSMLQNPPPNQQQPQTDDGGEESEGEEKEEEEQEGQDPNQEESQEQEDQQDPTGSGDQDAQEPEKSEQQQGEAEPLNRENIEAILQSLEDKDKEEQKNLRRSKAAPTARGNKWW